MCACVCVCPLYRISLAFTCFGPGHVAGQLNVHLSPCFPLHSFSFPHSLLFFFFFFFSHRRSTDTLIFSSFLLSPFCLTPSSFPLLPLFSISPSLPSLTSTLLFFDTHRAVLHLTFQIALLSLLLLLSLSIPLDLLPLPTTAQRQTKKQKNKNGEIHRHQQPRPRVGL